MRTNISFVLFLLMLTACSEKKASIQDEAIIANGQMPALAKDKDNNLHLVYGIGDSIMYAYSDDKAITFSKPVLISILPHVYSFAMRGPQIAATGNGIVVTACTADGNISSFYKEKGNDWKQGNNVNDADTVCKEGLMGLSADGDNTFAVWLDLRGDKKNKIY